MTGTCDLTNEAKQSWDSTHIGIDGGRMDGFIRGGGGPGCMGYWDGTSLPFYYGLAKAFPICDRWFTSAPCQTFPNRRFLQAGTSLGVISTSIPDIQATPDAPNGIIWDRLNSHGITWNNYVVDLADILLFPNFEAANKSHEKTIPNFLADCAAGTLPQVCLVSPGVIKYTEEDPNDVQLGEALSSRVINAVMSGPGWDKTAMFFTYDEHGGYYDHVPPPAAVPPDDIAPRLQPGNQPGGFDRYGPRVPGFVISPFAKKDYVSHVVHDHTSILKFIETKFNLGAMTKRDANADNLLDSFDFKAAAFRDPPTLPKPGLPATGSTCEPTKFPDPATIQPTPA
jgi:phospholipase C